MSKVFVKKPWGKEQILFVEGKATLKKLFIKKDESTSLQYHRQKAEFSIVLKGRVHIEFTCTGAGNSADYGPGESWFVPEGVVHRLTGLKDAEVLELCAGDDRDIIRLEDKYGRVKQ